MQALTPMQLVRAQIDAILARLIATGGPWDPAAVFVGAAETIDPHGVDTVLEDITVSSGNVGDRVAVTAWGTPYTLADGSAAVDSDPIVFQPATGADATTVVGFYTATLLTAGALKSYWILGEAVQLTGTDKQLTLVVRLVVSPQGTWDASISWNSE